MMDLTQNGSPKPAAKNSAPVSKRSLNSTTLFWHPTGPLMMYGDGTLYIADLNPQVETRWRMSRADMLALGWKCIIAAVRR